LPFASRALTVTLMGDPVVAVVGALTKNCVAGDAPFITATLALFPLAT
jgi:hypothetical protein